jgi:hypothetical protein
MGVYLMTETVPIYHHVAHDNRLPQIFQLTGAGFWQMRIYPPGGGNAAVFDVTLHENGRVEIRNIPQGFTCTLSRI